MLKNKDQEKKKSIIGLLGCFGINNILYTFLNTFMVAYFITLTNYDYKLISIYYIMNFICIALTFYLLGFFIKKHSKIVVFRTGIVLYCLYILIISGFFSKLHTQTFIPKKSAILATALPIAPPPNIPRVKFSILCPSYFSWLVIFL